MGLFSGSVLVACEGEEVYKKAYGYADLTSGRALNTSTAFYLASVSKQFTTMAIMILKERGRLSYDDNLKMYFPEFPDHAKKITLRHMMTHTSGLPDHYDLITKSEGITNQDVLQVLIAQSGLLCEPGTRFHYSNGAFVLLSLIIERASDQPFPEYMKQNIFMPLKMTSTLVYDQTRPVIPDRAIGYNLYGQQKDYTHFTSGAGGMYTTVEDLFKWDRALYTTALVSSETMNEAFSPFILANDSSTHYGFGWAIRNDKDGRVVLHSGGLAGFSTYIARYLDKNNTIIFLSNHGIPMSWLEQGIRNILNDIPPMVPKMPISLKIDQIIAESGIEEAVRQYKMIINNPADKFDLSESLLNEYGYYLLQNGHNTNAIEILKINSLSYPDSPNVYDSLGDAYEADNQFDQAAKNYSKALEIGQREQSRDVSVYQTNLERVRGKLSNH